MVPSNKWSVRRPFKPEMSGSSPTGITYRWMSRIGNAADCKSVASALGVQVPLHLLYACISLIWQGRRLLISE